MTKKQYEKIIEMLNEIYHDIEPYYAKSTKKKIKYINNVIKKEVK